MTSFGIEWETNILICPYVECIDGWREYKKGTRDIIKDGDGFNITLDMRQGVPEGGCTRNETDYTEYREVVDCLYNVEIDIGPIFNNDPLKFNKQEFNHVFFNNFIPVWKKALEDKYIDVIDENILPSANYEEAEIKWCKLYLVTQNRINESTSKKIPENERWKDCCLTIKGTVQTNKKIEDEEDNIIDVEQYEWAYHQTFFEVNGTPQLTFSLNPNKLENVFKHMYNTFSKWQIETEKTNQFYNDEIKRLENNIPSFQEHGKDINQILGNISKYKESLKAIIQPKNQRIWVFHEVWEIAQTAYNTIPLLYEQSADWWSVFYVVLLDGLCVTKEKPNSYLKSAFFFKPRTNSRHMADVLLTIEEKTILITTVEHYLNIYRKDVQNPSMHIEEYVRRWSDPEKGIYLKFNDNGDCGDFVSYNISDEVPKYLIYQKPSEDILEKFRGSYEEINYICFLPIRELLVEDEVLTSVHVDSLGEWYFGAGSPPGQEYIQNYIFECRRPLQLANAYCIDKGLNEVSNDKRITLDDLPKLFDRALSYMEDAMNDDSYVEEDAMNDDSYNVSKRKVERTQKRNRIEPYTLSERSRSEEEV